MLAALRSGERYAGDLVADLGADGVLVTSEGTVYPLLSRLRRDGMVDTTWRESTAGPPRRYYRLTAAARPPFAAFPSSGTCSATPSTAYSKREPEMPNATASRVTRLPGRARAGAVRPAQGPADRDRPRHPRAHRRRAGRSGEPSAAAVEQLLDELGTPQEIAEAAYAELPPARTKMAGRTLHRRPLLDRRAGRAVHRLGRGRGHALDVVGSWRTKDKVIGTLARARWALRAVCSCSWSAAWSAVRSQQLVPRGGGLVAAHAPAGAGRAIVDLRCWR